MLGNESDGQPDRRHALDGLVGGHIWAKASSAACPAPMREP